jgi:RNA polymerase sigma factor (sigma-70 family)
MTTLQANIVLRHIRALSGENTGNTLDGELLDRFATQHEEAAFAALVRRHGPLVLGVCRRVLGNWHDAEEAFQATFLVLARSAVSIRKHNALGSWLHAVAYRVSVKAKLHSQARQQHERQAQPRPSIDPLAEVTGRELTAVLDEEMQQVGERYRAPLVLCYLEGKTRDEAAQQLGWSPSTLQRRLERGREILRSRLARRGLTLAAVLSVTAASPATVSAALTDSTAQAALAWVSSGGTAAAISTHTAVLAKSVLPTLAVSRIKLVAGLLLAGVLAVSIGVFTHPASAQRQPAKNTAALSPTPDGKEQPKNGPEKPADKKALSVSGQVCDANDKPLAKADVALIGVARNRHRGLIGFNQTRQLASTRTDKEGHFRLTVPNDRAKSFDFVQIVAAASGHGVGWQSFKSGALEQEVTFRLTAEQIIPGRLIDLQGQPVKGAKVHVAFLEAKNARVPVYPFTDPPKDIPGWPATATTDEKGKFVIRGVGRDQTATLLVNDDRFARHSLIVNTGAKGKLQEIQEVLTPARLLQGTVVAEDTGKPLTKVLIRITSHGRSSTFSGGTVGSTSSTSSGTVGSGSSTFGGASGSTSISRSNVTLQTWTDEKGRFQVNCPVAEGYYGIEVFPVEGSPYLCFAKGIPWPKGKVKQEVEIKVPRGVIVRGKVTEADSGKPVAGAFIDYHAQRGNNPLFRYQVLSWYVRPIEYVTTAADGTFQATVPPGPGHLFVKGPTRDFVQVHADVSKVWPGDARGKDWWSAHAVMALDLGPQTKTHEVKLTLRRGVTVQGRILGPDGKVVDTAMLLCPFHLRAHDGVYWAHDQEPIYIRDGNFAIPGCDPKASFNVVLVNFEKKLGTVGKLSGKQAGQKVTIRLEPCGSAKTRCVNLDGKVVAGARPDLQLILGDEPRGLSRSELIRLYFPDRIRTRLVGEPSEGSYNKLADALYRNLVSDKEGRLTFPALIPGATYRYWDHPAKNKVVKREFTVPAGKVVELPDIRVVPMGGGGSSGDSGSFSSGSKSRAD